MKTTPSKAMEIVDTGDRNGWKTLRVTAPWEQVSADYDDILEAYCKIRIAGFRPGKAPRPVVEKRFQREIMDQLSRRCGMRLGREVLEQVDAEPMGPVEAVDIECVKDMSFQFTVRFHPMPEFTLPEVDSFTFVNDGTDPKDMISKRLLEQVSFEVPDDLIRTELGLRLDEEIDKQDSEWSAATDRVRLMLILKRIARQEGIEVDDEDVEERIERKALELGVNSDALKLEFEKGGMRQRLKDMLLAESTLDFLIEEAGT
ncbi:MAG: Trigger factor [Syntrophorhabdus sp. PtaU1.Bin002]|nr:MAG: Trigger factor [Syntrophorhabdus sp. PtaU1.Bin002]